MRNQRWWLAMAMSAAIAPVFGQASGGSGGASGGASGGSSGAASGSAGGSASGSGQGSSSGAAGGTSAPSAGGNNTGQGSSDGSSGTGSPGTPSIPGQVPRNRVNPPTSPGDGRLPRERIVPGENRKLDGNSSRMNQQDGNTQNPIPRGGRGTNSNRSGAQGNRDNSATNNQNDRSGRNSNRGNQQGNANQPGTPIGPDGINNLGRQSPNQRSKGMLDASSIPSTRNNGPSNNASGIGRTENADPAAPRNNTTTNNPTGIGRTENADPAAPRNNTTTNNPTGIGRTENADPAAQDNNGSSSNTNNDGINDSSRNGQNFSDSPNIDGTDRLRNARRQAAEGRSLNRFNPGNGRQDNASDDLSNRFRSSNDINNGTTTNNDGTSVNNGTGLNNNGTGLNNNGTGLNNNGTGLNNNGTGLNNNGTSNGAAGNSGTNTGNQLNQGTGSFPLNGAGTVVDPFLGTGTGNSPRQIDGPNTGAAGSAGSVSPGQSNPGSYSRITGEDPNRDDGRQRTLDSREMEDDARAEQNGSRRNRPLRDRLRDGTPGRNGENQTTAGNGGQNNGVTDQPRLNSRDRQSFYLSPRWDNPTSRREWWQDRLQAAQANGIDGLRQDWQRQANVLPFNGANNAQNGIEGWASAMSPDGLNFYGFDQTTYAPAFTRRWGGPAYSDNWSNYWNYRANQYPLLSGLGLTSFALNRGNLLFGLGNYRNPFFNAQSANTFDSYSYAQPLVTQWSSDSSVGESNQNSPSDRQVNDIIDTFRLGEYERALQMTDRLIERSPHDSFLHEFRSLSLFMMGEYHAACEALYPVLTLGPGWDWPTMARFYRDTDREYRPALRKLEGFRNANMDSPDAHFLLGYHYMTLGHRDPAAVEFQQYLRLAGEDPVAREMLAILDRNPKVSPPRPSPQTASSNPISLEEINGSWEAVASDGRRFMLDIDSNGQFSWKVDWDSRGAINGVAAIEQNMLILESKQGGIVAARISFQGTDSLQFDSEGGMLGESLTFRRKTS